LTNNLQNTVKKSIYVQKGCTAWACDTAMVLFAY